MTHPTTSRSVLVFRGVKSLLRRKSSTAYESFGVEKDHHHHDGEKYRQTIRTLRDLGILVASPEDMIDAYVRNSADDRNSSQEELHFVYHSANAHVPQHITHVLVKSTLHRIEPRAFWYQELLREVIIEEGVQEIGAAAFLCCSMITLATPLSMLTIGKEAFYGSKLTEIKLNVGLKVIDRYAFCNCMSLEKITVPSTVETIGESAFNGCLSLVDVCLQEGLIEIGKNAFQECCSLVEISVPSTVTVVRDEILMMCKSLKKVIFGNNTNCIHVKICHQCPLLEHVSLGASLEILNALAFGGCHALCYVDLPSTTKFIGEQAFQLCTSLSAISLPASMEEIRESAFCGCENLLGVEIPKDSNIYFRQGAFGGCYSLINFWLPPSMEAVSVRNFLDQSWAQVFYFAEETPIQQYLDRFADLPVHRACYYASNSSVDELRYQIEVSHNGKVQDSFGLTPFHIVATSAKPRVDVLEVLLNHYPWDILSEEDCRENTVIDYLLQNLVPQAITILRTILRKTVVARVDMCGVEEWKTALMEKVESEEWNGDLGRRQRAFREVILTFESKSKLFMTSVIELALWKKQMMDFTVTSGTKRKLTDRDSGRLVCGADVVIPNVVSYLWDSSSHDVGDVASSMFGYDVSWMKC